MEDRWHAQRLSHERGISHHRRSLRRHIANYIQVEHLTTGPDRKLNGATVRNCIKSLDGKEETFRIRAKGVINATGLFTD
jgi:glycerol-3-phosphate dehydrogenase